jgi:hypothetical protein
VKDGSGKRVMDCEMCTETTRRGGAGKGSGSNVGIRYRFRRVGHFCLPVAFVASPDLHGRFKCCPDSHSTSAFLSACLAMFCTSTTFTATAFPSPPDLVIFCAHLTFHHSFFSAPSPTFPQDSHMLS